jgi:ketosteroid isomerase-like protein
MTPMATQRNELRGSLAGDPPPEGWPPVQHAWFKASTERDLDGWRGWLHEDVQIIGVDGPVTDGPDAAIESMVSYYRDIGPNERIDAWITCEDPELFVWHGTIEPGTPHETKWCTVSRTQGDRILELRFFADRGTLAKLWGRFA